jgi:hypothetical protein
MCFLGFYIMPSQQNDVQMLTAIVVLLTAALWFVSFGKKTMIGGIIGFVAAVVAAFLYLRSKGELLRAFTDSKDSTNPYLYFIICFVVAVGVWLLAASRRGTFVLLVLGIVVEAVIHFLYHDNQILWLLLFLCGCVINLALQNYRINVMRTDGVKLNFAATAAVACICAIVVALAGGAVFYGVVRPLNPPTKKLYLLEKDMTDTIVDRMGLAKPLKVLDPDLITDETQEDAQAQGSADNTSKKNDSGSETEESAPQDNAITKLADDAEDEALDPVRYPLPQKHWWIPLIVVAAIIVAAIVLKLLSRRWWLSSVQKKPRQEQISKMYHLYLRKFRWIKEGKNREETPYEYAARSQEKLASLAIPETDFAGLTDIFVRSGYGREEISDEEYEKYLAFYKNLPGKLRQYLGLRYFIKFFIL